MDSTLILDHAETLAAPRRSLMPTAPAERTQALRRLGLALAACEKSVNIIYERNLRPREKQHEPWVERLRGQLVSALAALEAETSEDGIGKGLGPIDQAGVTSAVAWHFIEAMLPELAEASRHPALAALSAAAEALPEFRAAAYGNGTVGESSTGRR